MYPKIDPSDPATIIRWEKSKHNFLRSKIEVVDLRYFRGNLARVMRSRPKPVPVEMCYALDLGVAKQQRVALERFRETEAQLYAKARAAIYDYYREIYSQFSGSTTYSDLMTSIAPIIQTVRTTLSRMPPRSVESETKAAYLARMEAAVEDQLLKAQRGEIPSRASVTSMTFDGGAGHSPLFPKIVKGNELDSLVTLNGISVLRPKKGASRIGVHLGCPWDEEHGMGILIAGDEIESVGISEVIDLPASQPD